MIEQIFQTYVAASPVDVHYYKFILGVHSQIVIKSIIVMPDNRPLYRTRTKELDDEIIKLIQEASIELVNKPALEEIKNV